MKMFKMAVALLLVTLPWLMPREMLAADVSVGVEVSSVSDFDAPLATQGYWVEVGSYGRCWHPSYVASYWRPYCDGEWVWTDDGWYWQSDEPWAWATYHYGRWAYDPYYGWVWVPDTVWGPSWVVFREGGGYCGWAPLPPGARFDSRNEITIGVGFVPDDWFVCVGERHFGDRHHFRDVIIHNTKIINKTVINTRIRHEGGRVITEGPRVDRLQQINHEQIKKAQVADLVQHERIPPSIRREVPAPRQNDLKIQRQNEKQIERPKEQQNQRPQEQQIEHKPARVPQHERPQNKPPEIIRGTPNAPSSQPPPVQKQEQRQQLIERRELPPQQHQQIIEPRPTAPPPAPERKEHIEQRPSQPPPGGPPHGEKVAPQPKREGPPPQQDGRDRGDHGGDDEKGGRGR